MSAMRLSVLLGVGGLLAVCSVSSVILQVRPHSGHVFSDDQLIMSCDEDTDPDVQVEGWSLKRRTASGESIDVTCDYKRRFNTCVQLSPSPSDSGSYWCEDSTGDKTPEVNLTVTDLDLILHSPVLPVETGSDVTLTCESRPLLDLDQVQIFKDGRLMESEPDYTSDLSITPSTSSIISDVSKSDEGTYYCSAQKNGATVRSADRQLRVTGHPTTPVTPLTTSLSPDTFSLSPDAFTFSPDTSSLSPDTSSLSSKTSSLSPNTSSLSQDTSSLSPDTSPEFLVTVKWVLRRLLVGSPYCVCTVMLIWIYCSQRCSGSARGVSVETGERGAESDYVDADVMTEDHF